MSKQLTSELWKQLLVEQNKELFNRHQGQRCFILATGPSINLQDLKPLQNEVCIAVSNFFVHPHYGTIMPRYHCIAPYHPPLTEEAMQAWMDDMAEHVKNNRNLELFFNISDAKRNLRNNRFSEHRAHFLDFSGMPQDIADRGLDLARPVFAVQSVSVMALMVAVYMGFSEIYLLGCDHDWLLHLYKSRHFYQEHEHAFTRVLGQAAEWHDIDLEEECQSYIKLWQQYKLIRHIATQSGVLILNATKGGLLDVFPRVDFDTLFSKSQTLGVPFQRKTDEYGFFGDFSTWAEAMQCAEGYDAPQIIEKVKKATLLVKSGQAAYERDSVVFDTIPYEWIAPLAYWLSRIALEYDNCLNLIDFGGSLGSTYFALRASLTDVRKLKWNVVEQHHFAEYGNSFISDNNLVFFSDLSQCVKSQNSPIILLSATIEYLENPSEFIKELISYNFDYIIFDRTPFIEGDNDRLTVQFVPPEIYNASYPAWFFSKKKFLQLFAGRYEIIGSFAAQDKVNMPSTFEGFVFKRIDNKNIFKPVIDMTQWAKYNEFGDLIRQTDTPENKQHFLAHGSVTEEQQREIQSRRTVNLYLSHFSVQHQLITIKNKPTYAIFEMSSYCNMNCTLCNTGAMKQHFQGVERGNMPFEVFKTGMDKLLPELESILLYNWGEPFLNKELFQCIAYAKKHDVHTQLSTNMMLYTEAIGLQLIKVELDKLIISCDGLDQETYQQYRCGGLLDKVVSSVENIIALKQHMNAPKPHIEMQFVVFAFNEHQMQEYDQFWKTRGVDSVNFIQMSYMSKYGRTVAENIGYIPSHQDFQPHFPYGTMKSCSEPYNHVTIDWNGDWYTCCFPSGMQEYRIGNIITDDFWEVWNGDKYRYCRQLLKNQASSEGYCETMCHDCTGVFPRQDTKRYWL